MFKLQELRDCWDSLESIMCDGHHELEPEERKALEMSSQMMAALVIQLENQAVSFIP
jgi:hypothetical protein